MKRPIDEQERATILSELETRAREAREEAEDARANATVRLALAERMEAKAAALEDVVRDLRAAQ